MYRNKQDLYLDQQTRAVDLMRQIIILSEIYRKFKKQGNLSHLVPNNFTGGLYHR